MVEEQEDSDNTNDYLDASIPNKSYSGKLQLPINSQVRSVIEVNCQGIDQFIARV